MTKPTEHDIARRHNQEHGGKPNTRPVLRRVAPFQIETIAEIEGENIFNQAVQLDAGKASDDSYYLLSQEDLDSLKMVTNDMIYTAQRIMRRLMEIDQHS
jgi:hypothetical protein